MTSCLYGALVSLVTIAGYGQYGTVACPDQFQDARDFVVRSLVREQTPAISVVITKNDEVIWAEGFGLADIDKNLKATADTIYLQASVSKPLTATGVMALVDEGKVDLDQPANVYLPGPKLRAFVGNADDMTVRRLANHTSGMGTHYSFFYNAVALPPMDTTIERYGYAVYEPGSRWNYSNLAFGILEYITQVVSGEDWTAFMETRVYDPIGMRGTSDHVRPARMKDRAQIYTRSVDGRFIPVDDYGFDHPGASAIWSSAHDLARFCNMHLNDGELDGVRVLSAESARAMRVVKHGGDPQNGTGIGWGVSTRGGRLSISHGGGMPGVSTQIQAWPEDDVVAVVLTNSDGHQVIPGTIRRIRDGLFGEVESRSVTRSNEDAGEEEQFDFTGKWEGRIAHFDGDISVTFDVKDEDTAYVQFRPGVRYRLDNVRLRSTMGGTVQGRIPVQPSFHGISNLQFTYTPRDEGHLTGTVFATAEGYYGVTFFTELGRQGEE